MQHLLLFAGLAALGSAVKFHAPLNSLVQVGEGYVRFNVTGHPHLGSPSGAHKRDTEVELTPQQAGTAYTIQLSLGTPAQSVVVQLDTGSSDLWVNPNCSNNNGADQISYCNGFPRFDSAQSSTLVNSGSSFNLAYGLGTATVQYVQDTVQAGAAAVKNQMFGIASASQDVPFGILGIGPYLAGNPQYSFLIDNLKTQGFTQSRAFSLDLRGSDSPDGSIIFGAIDTGKYEGSLEKLPIIPSTSSSDGKSRYWINLDSIALGSTTATSSSLPVVLDSGATLCYLPQDVHTAIGSSFPTARLDTSSNYYIVDCGVKNQTGTVDFTFGEKTIKVPYADFVWDYTDTECVVGTQPSSSLHILGDSFLRSAYAVFDQDNQNIHLAQAANCASNLESITTGADAVPSVTGACNPTASSTSAASTSTSTSSSVSTSTSSSVSTTSTSSASSSTTTSSSAAASSTTSSSSGASSTSSSSSSVSSSTGSSIVAAASSTATSTVAASTSVSIAAASSTTTKAAGSATPSVIKSSTASVVLSSNATTSVGSILPSSTPVTLTSTIEITSVYTITACPATVTNCPVGKVTTDIITSYTTWCPVEASETANPKPTTTPATIIAKPTTTPVVLPPTSQPAAVAPTAPVVLPSTSKPAAVAPTTPAAQAPHTSVGVEHVQTSSSPAPAAPPPAAHTSATLVTSVKLSTSTVAAVNVPGASHSSSVVPVSNTTTTATKPAQTVVTAGAGKFAVQAGVGLVAMLVAALL